MSFMPAIRAARRLLAPVHRSFDEALALDHAVCPDGYGTADLYDQYDEEQTRVLAVVADRYGMDRGALFYAYQHHEFEQSYCDIHRCSPAQMGTPAPRCTRPDMHAKYDDRGIGDQCPYCLMTDSDF